LAPSSPSKPVRHLAAHTHRTRLTAHDARTRIHKLTLHAVWTALEGQLRFVHSRLITNAEEIAFYRGHKIEHGVIARSYYALVKHMNLIFQQRVFYTMLEGFLMKYVWSAIGMNIIAFPTFLADYKQQKIEKGTPIIYLFFHSF
jgi:ABC-type uncharacterized transport system fused permease/ATPase subunit